MYGLTQIIRPVLRWDDEGAIAESPSPNPLLRGEGAIKAGGEITTG